MRQIVLLTLLLLCATAGMTQNLLLQEDFSLNTNNITSLTTKNLSSGNWQFYYTDRSYNSITACAVLKYSGTNMGYIITPTLAQPAELVFDARMVGNATNRVEIQKSVNGSPFTTIGSVLVSGITFQQYRVAINETGSDVKLKLLRTKPASDGSNSNIIIDNVQVFAREDRPVLQVLNGTKPVVHNEVFCVNCYDSGSYIEIPFTLSNTGEGILKVSNIEVLGCTIIDNTQFDIAAGSSTEIRLRIDCAGNNTGTGFITIHSNSSNSSEFKIGIDRIE